MRFAVALAAAILFAAAPAVRAYCAAAMSATATGTLEVEAEVRAPADGHGAGHDEPCCCDAPVAAAADERASPKDATASGGKLPPLAFVVSTGAIDDRVTVAPRLTAQRFPPPEPAFRRFPRRLL